MRSMYGRFIYRSVQRRPVLAHLDRPLAFDSSNRVFYIYYLGNFTNVPLYHYGETDDIDHIDMRLRMNLPFYERVLYTPISYHMGRKDRFEEIISAHRATLPVSGLESWNVFTTDAIHEIVEIVEDLYKVHSDY